MNILRRFIVFVAYSLLPTALVVFGALFSIHQVFGSPGPLKSALNQSGIYDVAAAQLIKQSTTGQTEGNTNAGETAMRKAISDAVPPEYLKSQTGNVLDGVYGWLQGNTSNISFNVDLTPVKTKLVDSLTEQAKAHAQTLPTCTNPSEVDAASGDPFSATCLPPGVTPDDIANKARQQVESSDLFKNGNITPETIAKAQGQRKQNKSLQDQLKPVANVYKSVWQGTEIAGLTALIMAAVIILLSKPWQSGTKRVSVIFLSIGASSVVLGLLAGWATKMVAAKLVEKGGTTFQAKLAEVVHILSGDLRNWWVGFGALLIALGIGGLILIRFKKPLKPQPAAPGTPSEPISTPPATPFEQNNGGTSITN